MNGYESAFKQAAIQAAQEREGNFEFTCPICGGYCIGSYKPDLAALLASCSQCKLQVRHIIAIKKGA